MRKKESLGNPKESHAADKVSRDSGKTTAEPHRKGPSETTAWKWKPSKEEIALIVCPKGAGAYSEFTYDSTYELVTS